MSRSVTERPPYSNESNALSGIASHNADPQMPPIIQIGASALFRLLFALVASLRCHSLEARDGYRAANPDKVRPSKE